MKTRVLELTIRMEVPVPDGYAEDELEFRYEENYCVGNLIGQLKREMDASPRGCVHCVRCTRVIMPGGTPLEMDD